MLIENRCVKRKLRRIGLKNNNSKKPSKKPFRWDNFIAVITIIAICAFGFMVYADYNGYTDLDMVSKIAQDIVTYFKEKK